MCFFASEVVLTALSLMVCTLWGSSAYTGAWAGGDDTTVLLAAYLFLSTWSITCFIFFSYS